MRTLKEYVTIQSVTMKSTCENLYQDTVNVKLDGVVVLVQDQRQMSPRVWTHFVQARLQYRTLPKSNLILGWDLPYAALGPTGRICVNLIKPSSLIALTCAVDVARNESRARTCSIVQISIR